MGGFEHDAAARRPAGPRLPGGLRVAVAVGLRGAAARARGAARRSGRTRGSSCRAAAPSTRSGCGSRSTSSGSMRTARWCGSTGACAAAPALLPGARSVVEVAAGAARRSRPRWAVRGERPVARRNVLDVNAGRCRRRRSTARRAPVHGRRCGRRDESRGTTSSRRRGRDRRRTSGPTSERRLRPAPHRAIAAALGLRLAPPRLLDPGGCPSRPSSAESRPKSSPTVQSVTSRTRRPSPGISARW